MATPLPELLGDEQAHPLALFAGLSRRYGMSWVEWSASTLRISLEQLLVGSGQELVEINLHKALAAAALSNSDGFWRDWPTFHFLCNPLNNNIPNPSAHQDLTVAQMMVAVDIAISLRKLLKKVHQNPSFSEEVARYVAAQALTQGVWYLPGALAFAAQFAEGRNYKCKDFGNEAEIIFDDATCDVCTERWDATSLGSWKPNPDLVKKWGKNLRFFSKNPTDRVEARLEQVLGNPTIVLRESQTDRCVAHILVALQYVGYRREQYKVQTSKMLPEAEKVAFFSPRRMGQQVKWMGQQMASPKKWPENIRKGFKATTNMGGDIHTTTSAGGRERIFKGSKNDLKERVQEHATGTGDRDALEFLRGKKKGKHKYTADFHTGTRLRDKARRAGLLSNVAKYEGPDKVRKTFNTLNRARPGTMAVAAPLTAVSARENLKKEDPHTGRQRSKLERAGRAVGGAAADVAGMRVGMTAGMLASMAGESAGGAAGRGVSGTGKAVKSGVEKFRARKKAE